jgi:hypothetical protein
LSRLVPSSSALIPMSICTLQCLFSHSFTTYEWLNSDYDVQIYIWIMSRWTGYIFGRLEEMKIQFWTLKKLLEMIKWITFALILFVSCILGVLGEFLNILLTFWSCRKKSSRLFFDLFFTLYLSSPRSFGVILWRYVTHLSIVVFSLGVKFYGTFCAKKSRQVAFFASFSTKFEIEDDRMIICCLAHCNFNPATADTRSYFIFLGVLYTKLTRVP